MQDLESRVIVLGDEDVHYPFKGNPNFYSKLKKAPNFPIEVDWFPCYAHKREDVVKTAQLVEEVFPMPIAPHYYMLTREHIDRTNGSAHQSYIYDRDDPNKENSIIPGRTDYESFILLSGKRIPLHPAMTRYLVAHEYGHLVDQWISFVNDESFGSYSKFHSEYEKVRGIHADKAYGGRRWHKSTGEIIANDFRVLIAGVETEFWPHDEVPRPELLSGVKEFWNEILTSYRGESYANISSRVVLISA